jgi:hypothetical protein
LFDLLANRHEPFLMEVDEHLCAAQVTLCTRSKMVRTEVRGAA